MRHLLIISSLFIISCGSGWDLDALNDVWWTCEERAELLYVSAGCEVSNKQKGKLTQQEAAAHCNQIREATIDMCPWAIPAYVEWVNCAPEENCYTCNPYYEAFKKTCLTVPN
tara:strand:- start:1537 stop:1875 length:339 start_codon:yes stop_codon:yes gene_type:complete